MIVVEDASIEFLGVAGPSRAVNKRSWFVVDS
jgi:hypothetical protein